MSEPHEMIEPHWEYSKGFLSAYLKGPIEFGEYCYKQAFAHGMKHQREIDEAEIDAVVEELVEVRRRNEA